MSLLKEREIISLLALGNLVTIQSLLHCWKPSLVVIQQMGAGTVTLIMMSSCSKRVKRKVSLNILLYTSRLNRYLTNLQQLCLYITITTLD